MRVDPGQAAGLQGVGTLAAGIVAAAAALAVDVLAPTLGAVGLLQVGAMLVGFRLDRGDHILMLAAACSIALAAGYLLSPLPADSAASITPRLLALILVWLVAAVCWRVRKNRPGDSGAAWDGHGGLPAVDPGRFAIPLDTTRPVALSPEARQLLDLPAEGTVSVAQIAARLLPADRTRLETAIRAAAQGSRDPLELELRLGTAGKATRHIRAAGRPVAAEGRRPAMLAGTLTDLTELKQAELGLQEREARLRSILETAPEAIITINADGLIESFSASAEKLFGYSQDEVIGRNVSMLMPSPYKEEHDDYLHRYLTTGERRIIGLGRVVDACRKDGTVFPIELAVGEVALGQERMFTGFIRDLTARHRMEQELRQSQKMEAIGQLTGGVAHDFNNLLTVIMGNLEMLRERLGGESKLAMWADEAYEAAASGAELTARLLAFGRRQPLNPHVTDLAELVGRVSELLGRTLGESIQIRTVIDRNPCRALVDPTLLQNALINVAINARDAMPGGGRLTIELASARIDSHYADMGGALPAGRYAVIAVTDTGTGMTPEVRDRAFEPFFTTKPTGSGTGLGLSMVYGFVKQTGGHVQIYSEPGRGTTLRMYLPTAVEGEAGTQPSESSIPGSYAGRGEAVLVVEDDPRVRRVTAERLRELGYAVTEAVDGPRALAALGGATKIDLLLTDMVMPGGLNGLELAEAARAQQPSLRILLTSGYAEPDLLAEAASDRTRWLRKPHSALDLARAVREVLDGGLSGG